MDGAYFLLFTLPRAVDSRITRYSGLSIGFRFSSLAMISFLSDAMPLAAGGGVLLKVQALIKTVLRVAAPKQ